MGARETFEQAARAARRLATVAAELDAMGEEWRRGEWPSVGSGHGGYSDPTASRASYRMSKSKALEIERRELEDATAEASSLTRGIAILLGEGYAAALKYRYIEGHTWAQVAKLLGTCERTAYIRAQTALDLIDSLGPARVKQARGMATA